MILSRFQLVLMVCVFSTIHFSNVPWACAELVWESTFDTTADGVVDIVDGTFDPEPLKDMIGPVSNGRLQITTWDAPNYQVDKAGRPLGETLGYTDTMAGQYKFNWSILNESETPQTWELVGFLGNTTSAQTRQVMGTILRHWKFGPDYYLAVDLAVGGVGFTNFGYKPGNTYWLGQNPAANDYELRVEYDGTTHTLGAELLDSQGAFLTGQTGDLDLSADFGGLHAFGATPFTNEVNSLAFTHLGWEDYTNFGQFGTTAWQVDSLAYYDDLFPDPPAADADYNDDGQTDAADYVAWRKNFGAAGTPGTLIGDGTSDDLLGVPDGDVDDFDYDFWKSAFGTPVGGGSPSLASAVPEPASVLVVVVGLCTLAFRRRG
jgi:hypothetical protein